MPEEPSGRGLLPAVRSADGGGPQLHAGEVVELVQPDISVVLGEAGREESGTLFITNRRLIWFSSEDQNKGYSVTFLTLSLHAVSRDVEAYPKPCIYTQIDTGDSDNEGDDEEGEDEDEHESMEGILAVNDLSLISEMRFIPRDPSTLDHIFKVLCDCAALNPDPEGEREGEGDWIYNENDTEGRPIGASGPGNNVVAHLDELLAADEERFEDADENGNEYEN